MIWRLRPHTQILSRQSCRHRHGVSSAFVQITNAAHGCGGCAVAPARTEAAYAADNKNLRAICFAKSALRRPVWPIIRNILHPGRHKNTDMGAPSFRNILSINILNSHNAPKSLRKRRLGSNRFQKNSFLKSSKGIFQNILLPGNFVRQGMAAPGSRQTWP